MYFLSLASYSSEVKKIIEKSFLTQSFSGYGIGPKTIAQGNDLGIAALAFRESYGQSKNRMIRNIL